MRTCLGSAVAAALLVVAACGSAAAAAPGARTVGFSIAADGFPSYFRYHEPAGTRVRGALTVRSGSAREERVVLRAVDVGTAASGGLDYGSGSASGDGTWLHLDREQVKLPAGGAVRVPFTATIPPGTASGDHLAGIVALNRADVRRAQRRARRRGFALRFLPRLAIATAFTVPGPRRPALALGRAGIDVTPSGAAITLLLRNTGNTLLRRTGGRLEIHQGSRRLLVRRVRIAAFVPGTTITYRLPLRGTPARGRYRLTGELRPQGAAAVPVDATVELGGGEAKALREEAGVEAKGGTSPLVWVALGAAVAMAAVFAAAYWRARRALRTTRD